VCTEDDVGAARHLVDLFDEDRPLLLEGRHDMHVVHDLLAHVDGRSVPLEGLLDGHDGAVDTGAVASRGREQYPFLTDDGGIL
jgi:hypothetical protein